MWPLGENDVCLSGLLLNSFHWSHIVWQGTVAQRAFDKVQFRACPTELFAREQFRKRDVEHYWDLAYSGAILESVNDWNRMHIYLRLFVRSSVCCRFLCSSTNSTDLPRWQVFCIRWLFWITCTESVVNTVFSFMHRPSDSCSPVSSKLPGYDCILTIFS